MFTFQSIMFVSLGFLCALLLGFVVAPAFWARAVRLTSDRMRASLPLTEREISAERDRLRAENAIRVHQLTAKIEQARLYDARQKVEINRRDGTISSLERRLQMIETEREGSENARRVLEATITQRVPEIEARLMEARQLLAKRDAEMKALQNDTGRTFRALDDAMQVNAQQRAEIDRLKMSLAGHGARPQALALAGETETALRAELESVRARSREQAALLAKLQGASAADKAGRSDEPGDGKNRGDAGLVALSPNVANDQEGWDAPITDDKAIAAGQAQAAKLEAKIAEQTVKIEALTAQLAAHEQGASSSSRSLSLRETKTALKARAAAADKEISGQAKTIEALRRELATANERIARQASYYQDELRRLGTGGGAARANGKAAAKGSGAAANAASAGLVEPQASGGGDTEVALVASTGGGSSEAAIAVAPDPVPAGSASTKQTLEERLAAVDEGGAAPSRDVDQPVAGSDKTAPGAAKPSRIKLMERISGLAKS